tara:strand:+ start:6936 stop:7820 length:885 start_codon:yes stop_codon:yes gene_type:complete
MEDKETGNPEAVDNAVFGSETSFFDALEDDVNGVVADEAEAKVEETPQSVDPNTTEPTSTQEVSDTPPRENWKKRYGDSSREAQKMRAELNELKPFVPVLEAMKKDSGLVEHVRGYFQSGGDVPKNVKDELRLSEDFQFDTEELVSDPASDSRKVFNTMVDKVVKKRANQILANEKAEAQRMQNKLQAQNEAKEFKERNGLTDEEFQAFLDDAETRFKSGHLTFDDMYHLINRKKVNANVANSTKEDMLKQMKGVRDIPTSQSNTNNAGKTSNPSDSLFDALLDIDGNLDNLFG